MRTFRSDNNVFLRRIGITDATPEKSAVALLEKEAGILDAGWLTQQLQAAGSDDERLRLFRFHKDHGSLSLEAGKSSETARAIRKLAKMS